MYKFMPILVISSSTRSLQSTGKLGFRDGTHRHTHKTDGHRDLETELAQWEDSVKSTPKAKLLKNT